MRRIAIALSLMILTACQSLMADDEQVALQSELAAYGTEAASLREQMQTDRTAVAGTVVVVGTQVADYTGYNGLLAATVRAVNPSTPTPPPFDTVSQGPMSLDMFDLSDGEMRFVQVGTASQITRDDRCFVEHQSFFVAANTTVIYMTALALNLQAGTNVRVDWQYGGEVVYSSTWTAPQSTEGQCVALELRPSNAPFTAGNWTATMYINGDPIDPAPFTITGG